MYLFCKARVSAGQSREDDSDPASTVNLDSLLRLAACAASATRKTVYTAFHSSLAAAQNEANSTSWFPKGGRAALNDSFHLLLPAGSIMMPSVIFSCFFIQATFFLFFDFMEAWMDPTRAVRLSFVASSGSTLIS